jgi:hypothetical protein
MTKEMAMEEIGFSYISMLSAIDRMSVTKPGKDFGLDGTIADIEYDEISHKYSQTGFNIDFQLKSTTNCICQNGSIKYDLKVDNYKKLINQNVGTSRILILYAMPKDESQRLEVYPDYTIARKCAWWLSLRGMIDTGNKKTVRVEVPEKQLVTPAELRRLMDIIKGGGLLWA